MPEPTQSQLVTAGTQQTSTLLDAPPSLGGRLTWRLINDADGTIAIAESTEGIVEIDTGADPGLRRYDRRYTAPASVGRYLAIWRFDLQEVAQTIIVEPSRDTAFASTTDVANRLTRPLSTSEQQNIVPFMLFMATAVIADAAGYDDGWAAQLNPVPNLLRGLAVELVCRALNNPSQYTSIQQQVGSYSFQASWQTAGMALSDAEVLMVRRTVHGRTTVDVHIASSFEREQDAYWIRKEAGEINDPAAVIQ